jgi:hypothetical protein
LEGNLTDLGLTRQKLNDSRWVISELSSNLSESQGAFFKLNVTATKCNATLVQTQSQNLNLTERLSKLHRDHDKIDEKLVDCKTKLEDISNAYADLSNRSENEKGQVDTKSLSKFTVLPNTLITKLCFPRLESLDEFYQIPFCNLLGDETLAHLDMAKFVAGNSKVYALIILGAIFAGIGVITTLILICWAGLCYYRRRHVVRLPRTDKCYRFGSRVAQLWLWLRGWCQRTPVAPIIKRAPVSTPAARSTVETVPNPDGFETQELHTASDVDLDAIEVAPGLAGTLV